MKKIIIASMLLLPLSLLSAGDKQSIYPTFHSNVQLFLGRIDKADQHIQRSKHTRTTLTRNTDNYTKALEREIQLYKEQTEAWKDITSFLNTQVKFYEDDYGLMMGESTKRINTCQQELIKVKSELEAVKKELAHYKK